MGVKVIRLEKTVDAAKSVDAGIVSDFEGWCLGPEPAQISHFHIKES